MAIARAVYRDAGGLGEHYKTHYQDVDFCLRLRERGCRILYAPGARLFHHESATRGSAYDHIDRALLLEVWGRTIARGDPYYNPRLSLEGAGADYRPAQAA